MVAALSSPSRDIAAQLRSVFAILDDLKSQHEREYLYSVVVSHVRSAMPLCLLGVSDVLPAATEVVIPLTDGARVEVRVIDGRTNLYLCDEHQHDASVSMTDAQAEQVRVGLMQVMGGGR